MPTVWTPGLDSYLRLCWSRGDIARVIGDKLGIAKSAVVKRAQRLGLPPRTPIRVKPRLVWTSKLDAALCQHWQAGDSTRVIGLAMGVTKDAIIGRAHRLHLPPRPSPIKPKPARSEPAPETAALIAEFRAKASLPERKHVAAPAEPAPPVIVIPVVVAVPEPEPVVVVEPKPAPRITLPQSQPFAAKTGCQWPTTYGVKDHRFECVEARVTGWAYCPAHAARCYTTWGRTAA